MKGFGNTGGTGRVQLTGAETNGINVSGDYINLSPENYFFASPTVLYVADSGSPKNTSAQNETPYTFCGAGGLQKWKNVSGTWTWEYTLYQGLNLVANAACSSNTSGTTGLIGLTGVVVGSNVYLYATNFTIADLDPTYLYGITDLLSATTNPGQSFTLLAAAPPDSNFKGVSLAPTIPLGDVEITSSPSGLSFTSAGSGCAPGTYTTPVTLTWNPNSSCTLSVATTQTVAPGVQYAFTQWENETTSATTTDATFMVTAPSTTATYNATFAAVPVITWPPHAAIKFGSALSAAELDATASFLGTSVPGTFVYSPPAGTVLLPGANQTLSVAFTPTDTTDYTSATGTTTITVEPGAASGPADLVVTHVLKRSGGNVVVRLTIANRGGTAAANVVLTGVTVGSDSGTPLPQSLGTIPPGEIAQATVTVPGSVGAAGAPSSLTVSGTYTAGTFNSSSRITLP
jgi:hypothetical protein